MFNYQEIDALKQDAQGQADIAGTAEYKAAHLLQLLVYQNEQILRELNSIGYKLYKMQQDKNV